VGGDHLCEDIREGAAAVDGEPQRSRLDPHLCVLLQPATSVPGSLELCLQ